MFPKKVYHCPCVSLQIKLCLVNGDYSLKDICKKLNQVEVEKDDNQKIYCSKCGDNMEDVIFSCTKHMSLVIFRVNNNYDYIELNEETKNSCKKCIKKYLQIAYHCCYDYTSFDLPIAIKKEKKTLCLRLCNCNCN